MRRDATRSNKAHLTARRGCIRVDRLPRVSHVEQGASVEGLARDGNTGFSSHFNATREALLIPAHMHDASASSAIAEPSPWLRSARFAAMGATLVVACSPLEDLTTYRNGSSARPSATAPELPGTAGSSSETTGSVAPERTPSEGPAIQGLQPSRDDDPGSTCSASATCGGDEPGDAAVATPDAAVDAGRPVPPVPACLEDETLGPNGNCYVAVATLMAWPEARSACQARGADLTTIRSQADADFLKTFPAREAWVGGNDLTLEGTWAWVTDGFQFWQGEGEDGIALNGAFAPWFDDEPNGEDSSDCLRILLDGTWTDLECGEERASICEGPKR
jgi:lectin-like protein